MSDLISAAKNGYHDTLELLLAAGTSTEERDKDRATALYWGACRGHVTICETLLKHGCDIDAQVKWGSTALHAASDRGHLHCVELLITWKADINLKNSRGDAPLHLAAYRGFADIIDAFIIADANPHIQNEAGKTALQEAQCQMHTLAATKLNQYMKDLPSHSSLPCQSTKNISYHDSISPTSWPQNYYPDASLLSTRPSQLSYDKSSPCIHSPQQYKPLQISRPICQVPPSVGGRSLEAQENCDTSQPMETMECVPGRVPSASVWSPLNDFHQSVPPQTRTPGVPPHGIRQKKTSVLGLNPSVALPSARPDPRRSRHNSEAQEALEHFAESLQMKLVKYSEKFIDLEHSKVCLNERLSQLEEQNKLLLWQQQQNQQDLLNFQDLLAKERRKNFEVAKQQKMIERGASSSEFESRTPTLPVAPGYHMTHQHLLSFLKAVGDPLCNSSPMLDVLKKQLQSVWLPPVAGKNPDSNKEWLAGVDYQIFGDGPLNHVSDGIRNGSCSLVFQIRRKGSLYILKMMINLIDLNITDHNQGCSNDGYLIHSFGSEYHVPLLLAKHRNIVSVVHYYQGSTDSFRKYRSLLVPSDLDVPLEMASRTSFLVLENYPQTLMSFMVKQRTVCPEACYGLPNVFLLLLLYQLLSVIDHLLRYGIVHRDIKGDNVFLDRCLRPVLADFGFARSLHTTDGQQQMFVDKTQSCAGNSHAWAPEITRLNHYGPESLPRLASLQEVYSKSDGYAVSRMFYSLLRPLGDSDNFPQSSVKMPHYKDSELPDVPPAFSPGLRDVFKQLVLDNPEHRPTPRDAMLRVGCLLFVPSDGEVETIGDVTGYLQARALKLLAINKPNVDEKKVLNVQESINVVMPEVEADFLVNVTPVEFWNIYTDLKAKSLFS